MFYNLLFIISVLFIVYPQLSAFPSQNPPLAEESGIMQFDSESYEKYESGAGADLRRRRRRSKRGAGTTGLQIGIDLPCKVRKLKVKRVVQSQSFLYKLRYILLICFILLFSNIFLKFYYGFSKSYWHQKFVTITLLLICLFFVVAFAALQIVTGKLSKF